MKGKEWGTGAGEGGRHTKRNRQTASAVLATSYGPNFHPWFHRSRSLVRSFVLARPHTRTHAPCSSASRIFKQVISPPSLPPSLSSPLPTSPHPSITRPERTENGDLRSLPFDACQACLCLSPSQQKEASVCLKHVLKNEQLCKNVDNKAVEECAL